MKINSLKIIFLILIDIILLYIGFLNITNLQIKGKLPDDFYLKIENFSFSNQIPHQKYKVEKIDNFEISDQNTLKFILCNYKFGDSVLVKYYDSNLEFLSKIALEKEYSSFEVYSKLFITILYFFVGIFTLIKFNRTNYTYIFHILCVATGTMILFDRGSMTVHSDIINLIIWFLFDTAAYIIPALFLHFSIVFPIVKPNYHSKLAIPAYTLSAAFSITTFYLIYQIFINDNFNYFEVYRVFQNEISDSFLIVTILITVGILEHSALQIKNSCDRKQIYWVLLGITFGPLFFVFLNLIPRVLLGYELVEQSIMEYMVALAPITFLIAFSFDFKIYQSQTPQNTVRNSDYSSP